MVKILVGKDRYCENVLTNKICSLFETDQSQHFVVLWVLWVLWVQPSQLTLEFHWVTAWGNI